MADYFTNFSFMIPLENDDQRSWAERVVAFLDAYNGRGPLPDAAEVGEIVTVPDDQDQDPDERFPLSFEAELEDDGLWVHSDESGEPDEVIPLCQEYLRRFDPRGALGFEWAYSCTKPRLDAFGGGAAVVTATGMESLNTAQWLHLKLKEVLGAGNDV